MKKLWTAFALVLLISFVVLGWIGTRINQEAPPIVNKVVTTDGKVVVDVGEIQAGQNVWQSLGGMEVGSVWGHGSYVAPDWTADWLHREAIFILNRWAGFDHGTNFDKLDHEQQAQLIGRLTTLIRTNTYDPKTQSVTVAPICAEAFDSNLAHYSDVFSNGHPWRHVVTNVLGGKEPGVQVELHSLDLHPDDMLLLCSDGLTELVPEEAIAAGLQHECDPKRACERLVAEANRRGGKDNITVVVARA